MTTSSARICRGFSRIGIVVAFAFVFAGEGAAVIPARHDWNGIEPAYEQARCILAWAKKTNNDAAVRDKSEGRASRLFGPFPPVPDDDSPWKPEPWISSNDIGCFGPMQGADVIEAKRIVANGLTAQRVAWAQSWGFVTIGILAIATMVWLAIYLVGWAASGFARD